VNAGISPSGAVDSNARSDYFLKRLFQFVLNRVAMRLALPTGENGTVVRDN
jgi:hypothetical protein